MSDFKFALRALLKSPGFSAVAILTIAVGIGANTALFTIFDRLVLNPVTLPNPSSLVAIWTNNQSLNFNAPAVSWPRYEVLRDGAKSFSSIAISAFENFTLTDNGEPQQLQALRVSASFFPTVGVLPVQGRNFTAEEDRAGGPAVCILSHELWKTQFGSRASLVGESIRLNGQPWQVVGIMAPQFTAPFTATQIFVPRVFEVTGLTQIQVQNGAGYAQPIARLKPGVTVEQAQAELASLSRSYLDQFGAKLDANNISVPREFIDSIVGNLKPTFYTLIGGVTFVLLIACANVASLFLGRLAARHKEIAVRQSLGATRAQIIRQLLAESVTFSVIAGGLGILIGMWALSAVQSTLATQLQLTPDTTFGLDWRAFAFTGGVTFVSALLVGFVPALQASRTNLVDVLKDAARGSSSARGGRFRSGLIVTEVALSVLLLVGSSLLLMSFVKLQRIPPGFNPQGVAAAFVGVPSTRYQTPAQQNEFFQQVLERLRAQPQVQEAAAALSLPLPNFGAQSPYSIGGRPILPLPQRPLAGLQIVSDDYFKVMRIELKDGRAFNADDRADTPGKAIISESFAKRLFPGESAVGKVLMRGRDAEIRHEIVGVVADVKSTGLTAPAPDMIYYPSRQLARGAMVILARTDSDANALQSVLRSAVAAVDKDQAISLFQTLESGLAQSLGVQRIATSLTGVFAIFALVLAIIGLYSVLAYVVSQRTAEIGIRMALGAQPGQVIGMVMQSGLKLVGLGLVLGLVGAAGVSRYMQSLLFNVQPLDPVIYGGVALLFGSVAALACLVPSLRASRIDPVIALRSE
jgi:predicted permease